jgi:hypothetical protein
MLLAPPMLPALEVLHLHVIDKQSKPVMGYMYNPISGNYVESVEVPPVAHDAAMPPETPAEAAATLFRLVSAPRRHDQLRIMALHFTTATPLHSGDIVRLGTLAQLHTLELRR